jgi:antirestriction protein ArdC
MHNREDRGPPRDYRKEVTADIIKMLEEGTTPWQRPWEAGEFGRSPFNPVTGKSYRGGNILSLMIASMRRSYTDPRFCTFKQALDQGWHVKKGEKANHVEFWDVKPGKIEGGEDDEKRPHLIHKTYAVFNAAQIEGIPPLELPERKPFEVIQAGEDMLRNSGADIRHGGAKAYYSPSSDHVQMPPRECFVDEPHYYSTALHELAHWTGAEHRLKRLNNSPFGSPEYAKEEIRADLSSLFLSAELGIPYDPKDQAAYIQSWIQVLKNDKNEVFRAAADASRICDYLHSLENGKVKASQPGSFTEREVGGAQERQTRSR